MKVVTTHASGGQTDGLPLPELDLAYFTTLHLDEQLPVWREICTGEKSAGLLPEKKLELLAPLPAPVRTPARPADPVATHFAFGLIAAALVILIIAGICAWRWLGNAPTPTTAAALPETNSVAAASAKPVAPVVEKMVAPAPVIAAPPASPFASVRVQGILYRTTSPLAIINNKTVGIGDRFNDIQVLGIDPHSVTLVANGERKVFKFN